MTFIKMGLIFTQCFVGTMFFVSQSFSQTLNSTTSFEEYLRSTNNRIPERFKISPFPYQSNAQDENKSNGSNNEGADEIVAQVNLTLKAPTKAEVEKIKPIINVSFQLQNNLKQVRGVVKHSDCYNSLGTEFQDQYDAIMSNIQNNSYATLNNYLSAIPELTKGWDLEEKKCLIAGNVDMLEDNYNGSDLFASMPAAKIYNNYQEGLSTGVCVHLHHIGAMVGEAMGLQCGTDATLWMDDTGRVNHAVTLCKDPASKSYFMVNYGTYYELDGKLYSEAIDSLNYTLGPMNTQGSIISCFGKSDKLIDNCVHEYIPASTRWSLYAISRGMEALQDLDSAPINLEVTNTGLNFNLRLADQDIKNKTRKNGTVAYRESGKGLVAMFSSYQDTEFVTAGFAATEKTTASSGNSHQTSIFIGPYFYRQANPGYYSSSQFQDVAGLIMMSHLEKNVALGEKTKIGGSLDVAAAVDRKFGSGGVSDQLALERQHQVSKNVSVEVEQVGAINGDVQNNQVVGHLERTTLSVNTDFQKNEVGLDHLNHNVKAHILYSGYVPSTAAIELEQEIIQVVNAFGRDRFLELHLISDIGYTFAGNDPYYNSLDGSDFGFFYYKIDAQAGLNISARTKLTLYGQLASSDMPSWFGDRPLIIDPAITPDRRLPGVEAGGRIEVKFGKRKK